MSTIEKLVLDEISTFLDRCLVEQGEKFAVAFSGGSDSLALLIALTELLGPTQVTAFYVNHGLRSSEELEMEIIRNRSNCEQLAVELRVLTLPAGSVVLRAKARGSGIEDAARIGRYALLEESAVCFGCRYLATAHNADDQLETILKRVLQGSSIPSLEGITCLQKGFSTATTIIRPTLGLTHAQLQRYVEAKGFHWSEDSTNQMECYERNAIRKQLTPSILALYPQAHAGVARLTSRARDVAHLLESLTASALHKVRFSQKAEIALQEFLQLHRAIQDTVLLAMFSSVTEEDSTLSYAKLQQIRAKLEASTPKSRWSITSAKTVASLANGWFSVQFEALPFNFCLPIDTLPDYGSIELPDGAVFSIQKSDEDPLLIRIEEGSLLHPLLRSPLEGDRIELEGRTVLLSKLFSEWKIDPSLQKRVPVLEDTHGIVAVFGRFLGGKDRVCRRSKTPLAGRTTNIYSISKRNESSET